MQRYIPAPIYSITFLFGFIFFYFMVPPLLSDPDVFWHLSAGDLIRELHEIPYKDVWSYTLGANDYRWYNISWLYDIKVSFVNSFFGHTGVLYFSIGLAVISLCLVAGSCLLRKVSIESVMIATVLVAMVLYLQALARPHLVSFILIPLFYIIMQKARENHRLLYILPILMVFWVNTHGSIIAGFSILGAFGLEAFINKKYKFLKYIILVTLLCSVALLLNPYGFGIFLSIERTMTSVLMPYIIEWQPVRFFSQIGITLYILVFILASNIRDKKIPIADKVLTFGWLILGLYSVRLFTVFAIISAPYMAQSLNSFKHNKSKTFAKFSTDREKSLPVFVICLTAVGLFMVIMSHMPSHNDRIVSPLNITEEIKFLETNYPNARVLNYYDYGSEITYRTKGRVKIYFDSRAETSYPKSVVQDYLDIITGSTNLDKIANKYGFNLIIAPVHDTLSNVAKSSQGWRIIKETDKAIIFSKF